MNIELLNIMKAGGPLMWVIFATAFAGFALVCWQVLVLLRSLRQSYRDYDRLQQTEKLALLPVSDNTTPVSQLVKHIQRGEHSSRTEIVSAMNVQLAAMLPKLEGHLGTISTIGSLLPMLGLLGTVIGMINVFEVVAIHGSGKPEAMAEGISQALLTTASGLIFAIPVIFMHHLLTRKYNELVLLLKQAAEVILIKSADAIQGQL